MKIDAAVLREPNDIEVTSLSLDEPNADEVLVDVKATGVCHTDYHRYSGDAPAPLPIVLGHEGAGVVESVGENVTTVEPGDHVVLSVIPFCGTCQYCQTERQYLCERGSEIMFAGTMMDGTRRLSEGGEPINHFFAQSSFATKAIVHNSVAIPVDPDVPLESVALLGCGATTGLGGVLNTASVEAGEGVAIYGCGGVGMSAVLGAAAVSADPIIAIDVVEERLDATEELGATHTINPAEADVPAEIDAIAPGGVDYAFEFVGNVDIMAELLKVIKPGGTGVITGEPSAESLTIDPLEFLQDKRLIGNLAGSNRPHVDIPRFVEMHKRGNIDLNKLHTGTFGLDELGAAFDAMEAGDGIRNVVSVD